MSSFSGPSFVKTSLTMAMDTSSSSRSWKGEPTTNLVTNPDMSAGLTGYGSYSVNPVIVTHNNVPLTPKIRRNVLQMTTLATVSGGGNYGGCTITCSTLTVGQPYTLSFYARVLNYPSMNLAFNNQSGSGDSSNFSTNFTISYQWKKYTFTTTSLNLQKPVFYFWNSNRASGIFQLADIQIENKSYATPFTTTARSASQAISDLKGTYSVTAVNASYGTDNTFTLDGVDDYLYTSPIALTGSSTSSVSWGIWVYPSSTAGNIMSMSSANPQGSWNMPPIAATGQKFRGKIWSNSYLYSVNTYTLNKWYYLVLVFDYPAGAQRFYVNAELQAQQTGITYGASGTNNYLYIGQQNPGADNTGMFAGKIGHFHVYGGKALTQSEIKRNFNALRGRYSV